MRGSFRVRCGPLPRPPQPPPHPNPHPPGRGLTPPQETAIRALCADVHVEPDPWLAWARATAMLRGGVEATQLAMLGAATERTWGLPPTRWWRHRRA